MEDNTSKWIAITIIVITLGLLGMFIGAVVINNSHNIEHDEYIANHCTQITKTIDTSVNPEHISYSCK